MKFAHILGWINGRIILTFLYIVLIGPYAICRRIICIFKSNSHKESFWIEREEKNIDIKSLRQIF